MSHTANGSLLVGPLGQMPLKLTIEHKDTSWEQIQQDQILDRLEQANLSNFGGTVYPLQGSCNQWLCHQNIGHTDSLHVHCLRIM